MTMKSRILLTASLVVALAAAVSLLLFFLLPKEKIVIGEGNWPLPGGNAFHSAYLPSAPVAPLNEKWDTRLEGKLVGQAAVSADRVYAACEGGLLYCLELESGRPVWRYDAGGQITSMPGLCEDGILLGTGDGRVVKVGPSGNLKWQVDVGGAVQSTPVPAGDRVYFGSSDSHFYCVSLKNGSKLWTFTADAPVDLSPCVYEDQVFGVSSEGQLFALDSKDGRLNWTFRSPSAPAVLPCADNGKIFLATEFSVHCLDSQSGKILWDHETGPSTIANLAIRGNQIVAAKGASDKQITLISLDSRTGDQLWNRSGTGSVDWTSLVSTNQGVYFATSAHILAVKAEDGTPSLDHQLKGIIAKSLTLTSRMVFVATDNRKLYCFGQ